MPTLTRDEIKAAIADGRVGAITIDTTVFDAKQKTFHNVLLRRLDQFHKRDVRLVIADVIANEMKAHLRDDAIETQRALKKALRTHTIRWGRTPVAGEDERLLVVADPIAYAAAEFDAFLEHVRGEIVNASETPRAVEQTLSRYFSKQPPFGSADKRKSEFPDAFALLVLETFAASRETLLLCVAPDKGWVEFADQSAHLVCVDRLETALALFNDADQHLADAIVQQWRQGEAGEFLEEVAHAFEYRLDDLDFEIDGHADILFEAEPLSATLEFVSPQTIENPTVIAVDGDTVTFNVRVNATVSYEALFTFFVMDSIDKDHVDLGSEAASIEATLPFNLTINADRSMIEGIVFNEVEVNKVRFEVDFGYVEAFPNEDPTHEKY